MVDLYEKAGDLFLELASPHRYNQIFPRAEFDESRTRGIGGFRNAQPGNHFIQAAPCLAVADNEFFEADGPCAADRIQFDLGIQR